MEGIFFVLLVFCLCVVHSGDDVISLDENVFN